MGLYNSGITDLSELESRLSALEETVNSSSEYGTPPEIRSSYKDDNHVSSTAYPSKTFTFDTDSQTGDTIFIFFVSKAGSSDTFSRLVTINSDGFTKLDGTSDTRQVKAGTTYYIGYKYSTSNSEQISLTTSGSNSDSFTHDVASVLVIKGSYNIERTNYVASSSSYTKPKLGYYAYFTYGTVSGFSDKIDFEGGSFDNNSRENIVMVGSNNLMYAVCLYITEVVGGVQVEYQLPVGSYMISSSSVDPSTILGYGTWTQQIVSSSYIRLPLSSASSGSSAASKVYASDLSIWKRTS